MDPGLGDSRGEDPLPVTVGTAATAQQLQLFCSSSQCALKMQVQEGLRVDTPSKAAFPGGRASSTMLFQTRANGGQGPKAEQHAVALLPVRAGGWAVKARQGHTTQVSRKL